MRESRRRGVLTFNVEAPTDAVFQDKWDRTALSTTADIGAAGRHALASSGTGADHGDPGAHCDTGARETVSLSAMVNSVLRRFPSSCRVGPRSKRLYAMDRTPAQLSRTGPSSMQGIVWAPRTRSRR